MDGCARAHAYESVWVDVIGRKRAHVCAHVPTYICMYAVVSSHLVYYNKQKSDMLFRYYNILIFFFVFTPCLSSYSGGACKIQMICVCFLFSSLFQIIIQNRGCLGSRDRDQLQPALTTLTN